MPFDPRQQIHVVHVDDDPSFTDLTKTFLDARTTGSLLRQQSAL
ncbi:MAG: hypothetical protein J07HQX50_00228, partial [Haloquadratum sp. J07HQX50]